jgi:NAD(P)-dependent dehydrogenase (short-subunit alcohol dehydrogenase family)
MTTPHARLANRSAEGRDPDSKGLDSEARQVAAPEGDARPVLVTGASTGIGRIITEFLASRGHPVFAGARKPTDLEALARIPRVTPVKLDVTDASDVQRAVQTVRDSGHGLYGLVNNAGVSGFGPLVEAPVEELERVLEVNIVGVHRMIHAFAPMIVEARGRIVNIGSIAGLGIQRWFGPYGTSKHALEGYSDVLREELALLGVRVSLVEPGAFQSQIVAHAVDFLGMPYQAAGQNPIFREHMKRAYAFVESLTDGTSPEPTPVAEAVSDALFSKTPKKRYVVCTREWTIRVVDKILEKARSVSQGSSHCLTRSELMERLQTILDSSNSQPAVGRDPVVFQ